jgi:hypothetical protein
MSQRESKTCVGCGATFLRHPKYGRAQWAQTRFCSVNCSNVARATHGQRHTRLYRVWAGIKNRCLNPNDDLYAYYGARGINICDEWRADFAAFAAYIGPEPGPKYEVGRIKNELGYQPGNVRWETKSQNLRNKRDTRWIEYDGRRVPLIEACEKTGVPYKRAHARLKAGWPIEKALVP